MSETPAIDPTRLVVAYGYLAVATGGCTCGGTIGIGFEHEQGCGLELVMPLTELAELIQQGAPVLPEPDRWIPDGEGHFTPLWDTHDVVVAGGGAVIEGAFRGYREDLDNVAVYVPTLVRSAVQEATVAALDSLSSLTRLVDAVPVDSVADEPCGNDRAHGAATVYGGPCGGLCLPCAVVAVRAAPWDATDPAVVSLDVLRHPAVTR